jgi:hypothetical protein
MMARRRGNNTGVLADIHFRGGFGVAPTPESELDEGGSLADELELDFDDFGEIQRPTPESELDEGGSINDELDDLDELDRAPADDELPLFISFSN